MGFSSWDDVHRMFTFTELRLVLAFGLAVFLLAIGWSVLRGVSREPVDVPPRPIHEGTLLGGALFGIGWAISGSCPSIALVQLGEGQLAAIYTLAGIFAGNYLYARVHERYLNWSVGSCVDD
jgi:uncharacterized membrane protein YedE/YeeE